MTGTFAAFGDSITAPYRSFAIINGSTPAELETLGCDSWVPYAASVGTAFVGGFCRGGCKTTQIAADATPILADVTVVMAGTNDIGPAPWGTLTSTALSAITTIIVESKAKTAIVCAIAPRDGAEAGRTLDYNTALHTFVTSMGWTWVDPWVTFRAVDGQWAAPAMTRDGVHPTVSTARTVGDTLGTLISSCT